MAQAQPYYTGTLTAKQQKELENTRRWNNIMSMMRNFDTDTLLGYGLGKLLSKGVGTWWDNYQQRGREKEFHADNDLYTQGADGQAVLSAAAIKDANGQPVYKIADGFYMTGQELDDKQAPGVYVTSRGLLGQAAQPTEGVPIEATEWDKYRSIMGATPSYS